MDLVDAGDKGSRCFRASFRAYLVVTVPIALVLLVGSWPSSNEAVGTPWPLIGLLLVVYGGALVWLRGYRIRIDDEALTFKLPFRKEATIRSEDLRSVEFQVIFSSWSGPLQLVAYPTAASGARPMSINAKLFSQDAVAATLAFGARVAEADAHGLENGIVARWFR